MGPVLCICLLKAGKNTTESEDADIFTVSLFVRSRINVVHRVLEGR